MHERDVERFPRLLRGAPIAPDHDDLVARLEKLPGHGRELRPPVAVERIEDVRPDLGQTAVGAAVREPLRLLPFDRLVHVGENGVQVTPGECLIRPSHDWQVHAVESRGWMWDDADVSVEIVVMPDAEAAARAVSKLLVDVADADGSVVLAGGRPPAAPTSSRRPLTPTGAASRSGSATTAAFPPTIPARTNSSSAKRSSSGSWSGPTVHPFPTELPAVEAAAAYDAALQDELLDLVLLGLGPDGHTASLFPGADTLDVRDRLAVAAEPGLEPFVDG